MRIEGLKWTNAKGPVSTIFRVSIAAIVILAIVVSVPKVQAWSSYTHRPIAGWAGSAFSDGSFFSVYSPTISNYSVYPDWWKSSDPNEGKRHFYDYDIPHGENQPAHGVLPWTVEDNFSVLVQSLEAGNWDRAAQLFGVIAHYIGDASMPLHATSDYTPGGNHTNFEWEVNWHLSEISMPEYAPMEIDNIFAAVMGMLEESYGFTGYTPDKLSYWLEQGILWYDNLGTIKRITENRLCSAVGLLANVWYTAMVRSGLTIQAPTLIGPGDGENTVRMPTLTWAPVEGVNAYDLQLSTDNYFTSNVIIIKDLTTTSYTSKPLAYGAWYWRVRSGDNSTHVGLWSQTYHFTVSMEYVKSAPPYEWTPRVSTTDVANGDDVGTWITLPFEFPFWGEPKTRVWVCSNGFLIFDPSENMNWTWGNLEDLKGRWMIAPFWCDLRTDYAGGIVSEPGVYVDDYADSVVITWEVTRYGSSGDSIKFQVVLYRNGDIRINIDNATNFWNFYPTLGISMGDGIGYFDITGERETNKSWLFRLIRVGPTPRTSRTPIGIYSNAGFTAANGVVAGFGTESDPYVIENWDISASTATGIETQNTTAYFIIRNCYVHDGGDYHDGISFYNVTNGVLDNNLVENNYYCGISLNNSSNNTISNNIAKNTRNIHGIYLGNSNNNLIENNTMRNNQQCGIQIYLSSNNTISNNIVKNNRYQGILIQNSDSNTIDNNLVKNYCYNGIQLYSSNGNTISNNLAVNTYIIQSIGIRVGNSSNNDIYLNLAQGNSCGILFWSSDYNSIFRNNIINNTLWSQTYDSGYTNLWDGNYFSDYTGADADGDGTGDTPYNIYGGTNQDRHPLMVPWPPIRSVEVFISPSYQDGLPGTTLTYTLTITNTGNVNDRYSLGVSDNAGWSPSVSPTSLMVPAGENRTATLSVTIPSAAVPCTRDNVDVTAISQLDPRVRGDDGCIARVANTSPGENVQTTPIPGVSVTFSSVTVVGSTDATTSTAGPTPPTGYRLVGIAGQPIYYDITTTAAYSGDIIICISYDESQVAGSEENLRLMHKVGNLWEDITTSVDTVNNKIYGTTTTLSIFIVAGPTVLPSQPVGGIAFPADKLALLAPWIALAALITIVSVPVAVYWKRR